VPEDEAEHVAVEGQGLVLVIDEHAGDDDLHGAVLRGNTGDHPAW
jgi:hypothetical protein